MQNDLHHITQHFEQLYVSNGKLLSKEDTILENSIEAEPQQKEQVESVVVNVQPITPPVSTQTHESEDEWKRIFEEFSSKTATLEKEYVNIALQVAELERSTEEAKKYGEHNVDERQQIIETMQEEMNEIKNQVYLRKYSERAFFDYFFRTGESLERVKELKKHLETFTTKRTSEKIANDYPEMQNHVQNIDRLTEYITGIPMNQFLTSMEEICQQKEEIKQDSDEKQKEILTEIRQLKESLSRVQKDYRLLQTSQNRMKNRSNVISSSSRIQRSIYDDLNSLQLMALEFDIEKYKIFIQQGKLKVSQLQSQVDVNRRGSAQKTVFGSGKKAIRQDTTPHEDLPIDWTNQLDFSDMKDDTQKRAFLNHMRERLYPRNQEIRNSFERSFVNSNNFLQLYWNIDYWRDWYQMRQTHEYAQMLKNRFVRDKSELGDTLLDVKNFPKRKRVRSNDPFFFNEQDIPTIGDSWIMQNDTVQWKDQLYKYIYRKPEMNNIPLVQGIQAQMDSKLWKHVYKTRCELYHALEEKFMKQKQVNVNDKYNEYVYALCRISTRRDVTSNILSKYLGRKQKFKEEENSISHYDSMRNDIIGLLREQQKKRQEWYTRAVLVSVITSWLANHIKRFMRMCNFHPLQFYEKKDSDTFAQVCIEFVTALKKQFGTNVQAMKFNAGLLCNLVKQRLLTDQGTFWNDLMANWKEEKIGNRDMIINILIDEMKHFQMVEYEGVNETILQRYMRDVIKERKKRHVDHAKKKVNKIENEPTISPILIRENAEALEQRIKMFFLEKGVKIEKLYHKHVVEYVNSIIETTGKQMIEIDKEEEAIEFNPIVETIKLEKEKRKQYESLRKETDLDKKLAMMKDPKLKNREKFIKLYI